MVINNCYVFSFSNASNSNSAFIITSFVYKIHRNFIVLINSVVTGLDMNIGIARSNHILQLSYVYSVSIVFTCYYALDSAVTVKSILVNLNIAAFKADASCASACTSDGLNTLQGSIHRQAVIVNYQVLLAVFQLNVNLLIGDGNTLTFSQSYACNLVIHIPYVGYRFILACINVSYICILGSYAGQTCQFFVQCQTICSNLKVIFTFFKFNRNCIVLTVNCNAIACCISGVFCIYGVNVLSICSCSFIYRCDISTCFYLCLSSLQLCYVYSIGSFGTSCYVGDLTSNIIFCIPYGNSTCCRYPSGLISCIDLSRSKSTFFTFCSISN